MSDYATILDAADDIQTAIQRLDKLSNYKAIEVQTHRLEEIYEELYIEGVEQHFIASLEAEQHQPDGDPGFGLVDDGTMDTVLSCPKCNGWLRFDGREAAIMFLEDDRECWLCPETEE